jgi:hypothetical protein
MRNLASSALGWLGLGKDVAKSAQQYSRFHYSPDLIAGLKDDHVELLRMYQDIERMAEEGRFATVAAALSAFKARFDIHIFNENLHFYCYVEERLAGRTGEEALIRSFRNEMNAIARGVVNFIRQWRMSGVRVANGPQFVKELKEVGALLTQRIYHEEKDLYTLYQP